MTGEQDWRIDVTAADYFLHQQKTINLADRRPVINKAGDLVGPGINASAARIDDFNDLLATFNGYYSAVPGALNAPDGDLTLGSRESFVGTVVSDSVLGGRQTFTGLTTGIEFSRTFLRSPNDPESIGWSAWSGQRILATASGAPVGTNTLSSWPAVLTAPTLSTIGNAGVYERNSAGIIVRKQGVYTGSIRVYANAAHTGTVTVFTPGPSGAISYVFSGVAMGVGIIVPFTTWTTDEGQGFSVTASQTSGSDQVYNWSFSCTRVGDAV